MTCRGTVEVPNRRATRAEDPDALGHREIDRVDWSAHVESYPHLTDENRNNARVTHHY